MIEFNRKHPHRVWPHSERTDGPLTDNGAQRRLHMQACYRWLSKNMPHSEDFSQWRWDVMGWAFAFTDPKDAMAFSFACKDVILVEP